MGKLVLRARAFIELVGRKKGGGVHTCRTNDTGKWHVLDARHFTSYDEFNFKSQSFKVSGRPIAIVVLGRDDATACWFAVYCFNLLVKSFTLFLFPTKFQVPTHSCCFFCFWSRQTKPIPTARLMARKDVYWWLLITVIVICNIYNFITRE